jgi:DNA repair protein RecN (Recombination protein N)
MLSLLKIKNVALIDSLEVEFGDGLNLLTGETGSGKSIIVDSLGLLTGERVSTDLIKSGESAATIEGLFEVPGERPLVLSLVESGIEFDSDGPFEIVIRRELSTGGKNRIFLNDQLVTAALLRRIAPFLVDIHGQGDQASLFDPASHRAMLDEFAGCGKLREKVAEYSRTLAAVRAELLALKKDEADKLQLLDILRFQVKELEQANLEPGELEDLEEEKRRLNNVEKLSALSTEAFMLLYDADESASATFEKAARNIAELAEYDSTLAEYKEPIENARALIQDLSSSVRAFLGSLEFSPERLDEIENRLAQISQLARKYGGTVESAMEHLENARKRLENIEFSELRETELTQELAAKRAAYLEAASELSDIRKKAAKRFSKEVAKNLQPLALEKAVFEVRVETPEQPTDEDLSPAGIDKVQFYFSANLGELPRPLARIASGGEASRLMLILKTTAKSSAIKTAVFDEIDAGIGGRVSEAVGAKLKQLAADQQVLCVTHQPQVASKADHHFVVSKEFTGGKTLVSIRELNEVERVEEIARMLAGETVTEAARENARAMLASAS